MKRLTTDNPKDNTENALNLFYIKDHETWVRGGGPGPEYPDVSLFDFTRQVVRDHIPDADLPADDGNLAMMMPEWLCDGSDTAEGIIALLYTAAWSYAELRHRLMAYEDTGLGPEDMAALRLFAASADHDKAVRLLELSEADKEGRLVVLPCKVGDDVYFLFEEHLHKVRVQGIACGRNNECILNFGGYPVQYVWGSEVSKTVFLTREEAEAAIAASKNIESKPVNDLYDEDGGLIGE